MKIHFKPITLVLYFFFSLLLVSCAPKNCENVVNQYISFDAGMAISSIKLSVGLAAPTTLVIKNTDTQAVVGSYNSIYTVDLGKSCDPPQVIPELTTNVFVCISQSFYGICKNTSTGKVSITGGPGYSCPAGYTLETKYNAGC